MFVFKIDGADMPTPAHDNFKIIYDDIDSAKSTRNALGYLRRERVRAGMVKIELEYNMMSNADHAKVLTAIEPPMVDVTFFSPRHNATVTRKMYAGPRSVNAYMAGRYYRLAFNLVER